MIKKDVQFMGHDISKASVFVNLAKHKIAKALGMKNANNLKLKNSDNKRVTIPDITADSNKSDIKTAIDKIPISGITTTKLTAETVAKYICGPRGAAAMLAKSVLTKSKNNGGFKKLVSNELKKISSQKTKESSDPFKTLDRQNLCNYITGKKRGKQEDDKDARIADWLKYLCALLVLYVTKKNTDGSGEIPDIAASQHADKMYEMIGDKDVPLDPRSYKDEPPPTPPCHAMPIQKDPPISTVSLGQQLQHQPSKPNPATQATLELSMPQHHPIPKTDISQKPYIPIDNQLPPANVSLNQQPRTTIPKYRLVADLTTNEKDTILQIAQKLADLTKAQPMLSQDDFAKQARQTQPINACKEQASYNFIKINQVTSNEGTTITYGTKYDQNCTLKQTLDDYHTCRKNSQASHNICLQLIALSAGPCSFANTTDNPQLEIVKTNNEFVEKVKTALFPTHQNQQPQPKTYPTQNQIQYQNPLYPTQSPQTYTPSYQQPQYPQSNQPQYQQPPLTQKSPQQFTPQYQQPQYPPKFPQSYLPQSQQPQFTQLSPQPDPINQCIPQLQTPTQSVTPNPQQTQFTQQSTQQNPMNQYIPKLQPQTHTVTPNPQQTPSTQQFNQSFPQQNPMNQYIPQLQPPTQTVTPNPQQPNGWNPMPPQAPNHIPTTPNNYTPQPNPNLQPSNPLQKQVQPNMQIPPNQNNFQPQHQTFQNQPRPDVQQTHPLPPSNPYQHYLFFIPDLDGCKTHEKNYYVTMPDRVFVFPVTDVETLKALVTQLPQTEGIPFEKVPTAITQEFDNPNLTAQKHSPYTFAKLLFPKEYERQFVKFAEEFVLCFIYNGKNDAYTSFLKGFRESLDYTAYGLAVYKQIDFLKTLTSPQNDKTNDFEFTLKNILDRIVSFTPLSLRYMCTNDALNSLATGTQNSHITYCENNITDDMDDLKSDLKELEQFLNNNIPTWQNTKQSIIPLKNTILDKIKQNIIQCYKNVGLNTYKYIELPEDK